MDSSTLIICPERKPLGRLAAAEMAVKALFLCPLYFVLANWFGCRGLQVHARTVILGCKLLFLSPSKSHARWIYFPVESTRYFEIDFTLRHVGVFQTWMDVSSPRLLAAILLDKFRSVEATLLNPDGTDMGETDAALKLLGLNAFLARETIQNYAGKTNFDLLTCISVLEHIADDSEALARMWGMLRPGGRLIITVPVNASGGEQFVDKDPYQLVVDHEGPCFFQRFYAEKDLLRLEEIVGKASQSEIFGEREAGWLQSNFARKRSDPTYPVWLEPYLMAKNWKQFSSIGSLPGEGVYCGLYEKPVTK